jgi:hypothetical protein
VSSASPGPQEAAAIAAVMVVLEEQRRASAVSAADAPRDHLNVWGDASRRAAQRAGLQRGPWRLSGRIARRSRA